MRISGRQKMIEVAMDVAETAYAPYSNFKVGAVLVTGSGAAYFGTNIENKSYPVTCCAERVALFSAIVGGVDKFNAIAIVGGKDGDYSKPCFPCGMCRQALAEFCSDDFEIVLVNKEKGFEIHTLGQLLPKAF